MSKQKWIYSKILAMIIVVLFIFGIFWVFMIKENEDIYFVAKMGVGWNLGNSLDVGRTGEKNKEVSFYETYWNNPLTTRPMIQAIHKAGFSTLRIPVTWEEHLDKDGQIDPEWMKRVRQVVDYGIDEGMYVIINAHHDTWYTPTSENRENALQTIRGVWGQIATEFAQYDEHLIFESMNEPRLIGRSEEWTGGTGEAQELVNIFNKEFVDVVRKSGKENYNRYLMIPPYGASSEEEALKAVEIPDGHHLILSIHPYIPYDFTLNEEGTPIWSKDSLKDTEEIDDLMKNVKKIFLDKKTPVIISEFGALDKNNIEERLKWLDYYKEKADQNKVMLIWWDPGDDTEKSFRIFDRNQLEWLYPQIKKLLLS